MAGTTVANWNDFLLSKQITFKSPPFGLASAPKSTAANIAELQKDYRGFVTPDDYNKFVTEIGPGTLGRVRIYAYEVFVSFRCFMAVLLCIASLY